MSESMRSQHRLIGVLAVAVVVIGLVLALWSAASGPSLDWSANSGDNGAPAAEPAQETSEPDECVGDECAPKPREPSNVVGVVIMVLLVLLGVVLLAAVVALLRTKGIGLFARRRGPYGQPGEPLPDVAARVRADAEAQYEALRTGSPRNAIVACWVRLEDAVTSAGMTVRGAETSAELTGRVLAKYGVDDAAITRLAALYREARFSRHELTEQLRAEAIGTLERIHASLEARPTTRSEVAG
ncbi:DUF4129 domain-containing protein [Nocardioidaceae bacterium SCSIO 66511]|nr:DUF4129 domain-containing protein [Nocardioidaceae bacterium SCSIO 66511]